MNTDLLRSRHAFGSEANVDAAIEQGLIDAYDILFLKEGKIGWINADGEKVILNDKSGVMTVDVLPENGSTDMVYICDNKLYFWDGNGFISPTGDAGITDEEVDAKIDAATAGIVDSANAYTDDKIELAKKIKFEITSKPVGTLVNYSEKEIRVMCPSDTKWEKQQVGATGNANMYYMAFKAYAPEGAVSFKEGDRGEIVDEMFTFDHDFAGTDELGRNYSIVWFALASYDEASDTWTYFGAQSSEEKYIGWTYVVEWYDTNGVIIAKDGIRINLANEQCYSKIEPYYVTNMVGNAVDTANAYTDEQIANAFAIVEF